MADILILPGRFFSSVKRKGLRAGLAASGNYLFFPLVSTFRNIKYKLLVFYYHKRRIEVVSRTVLGSRMFLRVSDTGLSRRLLMSSRKDPAQVRLVEQIMKPGMVMVDVGANLGYFTLFKAGLLQGRGKVYAIEPVPENFELLCRSIRENRYQDVVEAFCCAVSDVSGTSGIARTRESNFATMLLQNQESSEFVKSRIAGSLEEVVPVKTVTLDEFLRDKPPVDFIMMDIEGYETKALRGMEQTLKNARKGAKICLEIHPNLYKNPLQSTAEMMSKLAEHGFTVRYVLDSSGSGLIDFSGRNLLDILCSSGEAAPRVFLEKTGAGVC